MKGHASRLKILKRFYHNTLTISGKIMSEFTEKKAQNLIDTESILQIDENTYQVRSSVPGKSYITESGICECLGFRYRNTYSHAQAVKMIQQKPEEISCL